MKTTRKARTGTETTHSNIRTHPTADSHSTLPPVLHPTAATSTAPHPPEAPLPGDHGTAPHPPHSTAASLPGNHGTAPNPPHPTAASLPPKLTIQDFMMNNELESLMEIQQDIHCYLFS